MPALWPPFEQTVTHFLTKGTLSQDQFVKMLAAAYTVATTPITVKYGSGPTPQPVLNGPLRQKILRDAIDKMLSANRGKDRRLTVADFLPAALAFVKYWTPGVGVLISPFPPAPPCVAPVPAGFFISEDQFNSVMGVVQKSNSSGNANSFANISGDGVNGSSGGGGGDGTGANGMGDTKSLFDRITGQAVANDPVVLIPSPIVLFPGNPLLLAKDLHFAMTKSNSPQATATNLTKAFSNHLSTIIGIYIGFLPPGSLPPFTIVVFNGIT